MQDILEIIVDLFLKEAVENFLKAIHAIILEENHGRPPKKVLGDILRKF